MAVGSPGPKQVESPGDIAQRVSSMSNQIDDNGTAYSNRSHHESRVGTTSACLALALCALVEHVAQDIVIAIFVHVVNADMSLQVIRSRVSVLTFWAERADIAWTVVHQAMANHLVLAFESLAAFGARTACDRAVVWSTLTVHILVRV